MSKTTKPLPARAMIVGRADLSDFDARARPVSEVLADIDVVVDEMASTPRARADLNPDKIYRRWNSQISRERD